MGMGMSSMGRGRGMGMGRGRGQGGGVKGQSMMFSRPAVVINKKKYTMPELIQLGQDGPKVTPPDLKKILVMFENSSGTEASFDDSGPTWERGTSQPAKTPLAPGAVPVAGGGKKDMWARGQILVGEPPKDHGGGGGGGGRGGNQGFIPRAGPTKALSISENRWAPGKEVSKQAAVSKQVKGILNKMTPQRFEKLSQQIFDIPMESTDMQSELIALVFEKALAEPSFGEMYAELCVKLHNSSKTWPFIKHVLNEDDQNHFWICDVDGVNSKVSGPYDSVDACKAAAMNDEEAPLPPVDHAGLGELAFTERCVKGGKFLKIVHGETGYYWTGNTLDDLPADFLHGPHEDEESAIYSATRKTSFKRILLNKCQEEFEKDAIYEELQAEMATNSALSPRSRRVKEENQEEMRIKIKHRMLGNIRFIGELYKKAMLKANIMHECLQKLLCLNVEDGANGRYKVVPLTTKKPDEEDVEALCKLWQAIGKHIDHFNETEDPDQDLVEQYFAYMVELAGRKEISSRIRFSLMDCLDLRKNRWEPRRGELKQQTLAEIRAEAEAERDGFGGFGGGGFVGGGGGGGGGFGKGGKGGKGGGRRR
jgi:translation initiation factor 4G